jgi:hypothetical protein
MFVQLVRSLGDAPAVAVKGVMAGLVPAIHVFNMPKWAQENGADAKLCFCESFSAGGDVIKLVSEAAPRGWPGQARP